MRERKRSFVKICAMCHSEFRGIFNQLICSQKCKKKTRSQMYPGLNYSSTGAVGELKVCADLLIKGYEVFRAVSPSSSCDLLALKNGKILRIEVRTARTKDNGSIAFPGTLRDAGRSDHFAAAGKNEVYYFPSLEDKA